MTRVKLNIVSAAGDEQICSFKKQRQKSCSYMSVYSSVDHHRNDPVLARRALSAPVVWSSWEFSALLRGTSVVVIKLPTHLGLMSKGNPCHMSHFKLKIAIYLLRFFTETRHCAGL